MKRCTKLPAPVWDLETVALMSLSPSTPRRSGTWVGGVRMMVCKASSSSPETWASQRVFVNYECVSISPSAVKLTPPLLSRKGLRAASSPPTLDRRMFRSWRLSVGCRNPEFRTWALTSPACQPGEHPGDTLAPLRMISGRDEAGAKDKITSSFPSKTRAREVFRAGVEWVSSALGTFLRGDLPGT